MIRSYVFLSLLAVLSISCSSNSTPSSSSSFQLNGVGIFATVAQNLGVPVFVSVGIVDSKAQPVTNAVIALTYSGGSIPITYVSNGSVTTTVSLSYNGGTTLITCAPYTSSTSWSYVTNQPYTFTAAFGGNTYSASATAAGNIVFTPGAGSVTCTWVGGSQNSLSAVDGNNSLSFGPSLTSPYVLFNSSLPNYSSGVYTLTMGVGLRQNGCFSSASSFSFFTLESFATTIY
jgi:hypothetical protein